MPSNPLVQNYSGTVNPFLPTTRCILSPKNTNENSNIKLPIALPSQPLNIFHSNFTTLSINTSCIHRQFDMSNIKAGELIIGADTYEGAFEEENESHQESDGAIAEGDHFSLCSDCTVELDGIMDDVEGRLYSVDNMDVEVGSVENSTDLQNNCGKINGLQSDSDSDIDDDMKPIPRGKSIAHFYMHRRIVYVSLDLEHGGESCGIVQLSCQLFRLRKDTIQSKLVGEVENITFNEFVQPPKDAIWNENVCKCHGLSSQHQCIVDADPISVVWKKIHRVS